MHSEYLQKLLELAFFTKRGPNKYFFFFRPILVLKCDQGFVGYRTGTIKLECNKAIYETIQVERGDLGIVFFKGKRKVKHTRQLSC